MKKLEDAKKLFTEGIGYFKDQKYFDAENKFKKSLLIVPDRISTLLNLAAAQIKLHKNEKAIDNLKIIIKKEPDNFLALMNISNAYANLRDFEKALHFINKAIDIDKKNPDLLANKASILRFTGKIESALEYYEKALLEDNSSSLIKFNKSICELLLERFHQGWINYEYRETNLSFNFQTNIKPNKNMKILILSEQGIGDVVMFASLLSFLRDFENITFIIDQRLIDIYQYSYPNIRFINFENFDSINLDEFFKIRIGSLAQFYIKSIKDFTKLINPFLKIPPNIDLPINDYIDNNKVNIGVYWSSHSIQSGKVTKLELSNIIKSLNLSDKNFISLQDGDYDEEIKSVEKTLHVNINKISNFDLKNDLNHLAKLISKCNLIISISTTVVHLAGALGIPTIILCQYSPDWRFFQFKEKFP